MPRVARILLPGLARHVTRRGNNRQDVFFVDDDRRAYPGHLAEQAERYGPGVLGCCLVTNHVRLLGVPARAESLAKAVSRTHSAGERLAKQVTVTYSHLASPLGFCPAGRLFMPRIVAALEQAGLTVLNPWDLPDEEIRVWQVPHGLAQANRLTGDLPARCAGSRRSMPDVARHPSTVVVDQQAASAYTAPRGT